AQPAGAVLSLLTMAAAIGGIWTAWMGRIPRLNWDWLGTGPGLMTMGAVFFGGGAGEIVDFLLFQRGGRAELRKARNIEKSNSRKNYMQRFSILRIGLALAIVATAAGCQEQYFLMLKEPKKKVGAEFGKLEGKTSAIVVWCDQATLDQDPNARYRV